jgi:ABC-2 type transport system ATP-binding protein
MIDIQNLSFGYRRKKLLYRDLTLTLREGSIYGLFGKNGAGKSTLLRNLSGLLFPIKGSILVNGFIPVKRLPAFLETIYLIPEEVYVPSLTIREYEKLFSPFYPGFDHKEFHNFLEQLDVKNEGRLNALSFGQQKKFIVAFALACNTRILLLDEPTNGLDIPSKICFRKLIASVLRENRTILISTHQVRDLDSLIDQVIILDEGKLLLNASLKEIAERLCFKTVAGLDEIKNVLYQEESLKGYTVVSENMNGEETKVNLELLFNAVTGNSEKARIIFKPIPRP